jgi:3-dehydroquinate synthase
MKSELKIIENFDEIRRDLESLETDLILIVTDPNIWQKYKNVSDFSRIEGKKVIIFKATEGENAKTLHEYSSCVEFFLEKGVHRNAHLVALGGGAVSDFAGFVAATLLRGISWSIIPTTLLSMVDASIGGKTGINSKDAKNQIGSFHPPEKIWLYPRFLETLPEKELWSGKGEIIKYCFLNKEILELVMADAKLDKIIEKCALYKLALTEQDLEEKGLRKILNLGHTLGHCIEKIYNMPHGVAVIWGMSLIFNLFQEGKWLDDLKVLRRKLQIGEEDAPWFNRAFPTDKIIELLYKDKKMISNKHIDMVLVEEIGRTQINAKSIADIEKLLEGKADELRRFTL